MTTSNGPAVSGDQIHCDALPGFRLITCVGRGLFGEVWQARNPRKELRAVQILDGFARHQHFTAQDLVPLEVLRTLRHPHLAEVEQIVLDQGRILLVTPWPDQALHTYFEYCRNENGVGIPREELLRCFRGVAEALDYLNEKHQMPHLGLNPGGLWLRKGEALVVEAGLAVLLWHAAGQPLAKLNPRYAPPEFAEERYTRTSDQYSLAVLYQELSTGQLPHQGSTVHQITQARLNLAPNLSPLPMKDRAVVARALERDPQHRHASCLELIRALENAALSRTIFDLKALCAQDEVPPISLENPAEQPPPARQLVNELVQQAMAKSLQIEEDNGLRYLYAPEGTLQHRCAAWLPAELARHKLAGFFQQWRTELVSESDNSYVFRVELEPRMALWRWLAGQPPTLEVEVLLNRPLVHLSKLTAVTIRMRYLDRRERNPKQVLERVGPLFLESLRTYLMAPPEQRDQERFPFTAPLWVVPLFLNRDPAAPIRCVGRDISFSGINFHSPVEPDSSDVDLFFHVRLGRQAESFAVGVPATILRVVADHEPGFSVAARFLLETAPGAGDLAPAHEALLNRELWEPNAKAVRSKPG